MRYLEGLFERLGEHAEMNPVWCCRPKFEGRPVQPPVADARPVGRLESWGFLTCSA